MGLRPGVAHADPSRPGVVYIGGGDDGVWESDDFGLTWTKINQYFTEHPARQHDGRRRDVPHGDAVDLEFPATPAGSIARPTAA